VIAYGVCIGSEQRFAEFAEPAIWRVAGSDPVVLKRWRPSSIAAGYNSILDEARALSDLEALVLLHDDTELRDERFEANVKELFSDGSIGLAGAIGASHVTSVAWWEGERHGRAGWNGPPGEGPRLEDFGAETVDVDCVDGILLVLSPWVVEHLRFDAETFPDFDGYGVDFGFSVRRAGKRVVVSDFPLHHHNRTRNPLGFRRADVRWRAKWGFDSKLMVPARLAWIPVWTKLATARIKLASAIDRLRR
jgi:GT2 family glycosyltransferase